MDIRHLMKVDDFLNTASKHISFAAINPLRTAVMEREFFRNKKNPEFTYAPTYPKLDKLRDALRAIKVDNTPLGDLLFDKRDELINKIDFLKNRGDSKEFTKATIKVYGKPEKALVNKAYEILNTSEREELKNTISTKQAILLLQKALDDFNCKTWSVKSKDMPATAWVEHRDKTIYLKKKDTYNEAFIKRLIVHEVGTHVLRVENGLQQPYKIFYYGSANYLTTEEGLAVFNEDKFNVLDTNALRSYAGRVVGAATAMSKSFIEVYDELCEYFPTKIAYRLTVRVKRGIGDTSEPGGCTKDMVYLKGYLDLKRLEEKGKDLSMLNYGKIAHEYLDVIPKLPGLVKPRFKLENLKVFKSD